MKNLLKKYWNYIRYSGAMCGILLNPLDWRFKLYFVECDSFLECPGHRCYKIYFLMFFCKIWIDNGEW
jgi:hypothetical protein